MTRLSGLMKETLPICCVVVALLGLSCPFGDPLKISITVIQYSERVGVACTVFFGLLMVRSGSNWLLVKAWRLLA